MDNALVVFEDQADVISYSMLMRDLMEVASDSSYAEFRLSTQILCSDLQGVQYDEPDSLDTEEGRLLVAAAADSLPSAVDTQVGT